MNSKTHLESGSRRNGVIDKMLVTIKIYLVAIIFLYYQTQLCYLLGVAGFKKKKSETR